MRYPSVSVVLLASMATCLVLAPRSARAQKTSGMAPVAILQSIPLEVHITEAPAITVSAPVGGLAITGSVTVANTSETPVPVVNVGSTVNETFRRTMLIDAVAEENEAGCNVYDKTLFTVPEGKQFVVEHVGYRFTTNAGYELDRAYLEFQAPTAEPEKDYRLALQINPPHHSHFDDDNIQEGSQVVKAYFNQLEMVKVGYVSGGSNHSCHFSITVSGYLTAMPPKTYPDWVQ